MTAIQMNAEILRNMSIIAEDENLMKRAAKYLRKLVSEKKSDSTLMTEAEFFSKIEHAEQQMARGEGMQILPDEDLSTFLKRNGYAI